MWNKDFGFILHIKRWFFFNGLQGVLSDMSLNLTQNEVSPEKYDDREVTQDPITCLDDPKI
jgi:hypothetical protein